jgi:serine/threonine-protein kinase
MAELPPFPSQKVDRRLDARVPFDGPVTQYGDDGNLIWKAVNLSDSGMFLTGNPILPLDAELELGFTVPGYELEILTEARVRWRNHPNDPDFDRSMPSGIGVAFTDIDPECGKVLRKFMASHRPPAQAARPAPTQDAAPVHAPAGPSAPAPAPTPAPAQAGNTDNIADLIADTLDEFVDDSLTETPFSAVDEMPLDEEDEALLRERLAPGTVLGSYKLAKWLGSGGMGDVYLAEHTQLGRMVALKRLRSDFANNRAGLQRFFQEARAVNQIHHEHIVEITDFIQESEHTYCVMEFLDGPTLAELVQSTGIMPLTQALGIALQVCDALEAVHQAGIVHRDLKPQNIMLIERIGEPHFVKLLDFGVAKLIEGADGKIDKRSGAQTTGSMLLGTPAYMSPEQLLGNPVDHRADVYALGVILYEMTTGTNPFVTETWGQAVVRHATQIPDPPSKTRGASNPLPGELEQLILKCLEKDPNKRPDSIAEVGADLQRLLAVGPDLAPLSAAVGVRAASGGGGAGKWIAAAAVAVVLLGAGGLLIAPKNLRPGGFSLPWENGDLTIATGPTAERAGGSEARPAEADAQSPAAEPETPATEPETLAARPGSGPAPVVGQPDTLAENATGRLGHKGRKKRKGGEVAVARPSPVGLQPKPEPVKPPPKPEPKPVVAKPQPRPEPKPVVAKPEPKPEPKPVPKPVVAKPEPKPEPRPAPAAEPTPSKADQFYEQGKLMLKQNKALLAVEEFKKCLKENPRHARSYKMLGRAYIMLGRESDAIDAFENYVKLAPNAKDAPKVRAIIDKFRGQ